MNDTSCKITLKVGDVLNNKWVILEFIDKGGMGEVYRAHQTNLNRDVAIKVISKEWIDSIDQDDEEAATLIQRFRREVQTMSQIRHPNVLQIYDHDSVDTGQCGENGKIEYIAMEYIPSGSLRSTMSEEGFFPDEEAVKNWIKKYFMPVLAGAGALHDKGIVHRDLKPENILMDGDIPKIADFGLARSNNLKPVTQSIEVKGSPHYMSPEHFFEFKRADQRADVYSLGKILFEAVQGKIQKGIMPFKSVSLEEADTTFFKLLDHIIQKATAESRDERTGSVRELADQLEQVLNMPDPEKSKKKTGPSSVFHRPAWIWTGIIIATVSMLLMTIWHLMGEPGLDSIKNKKKFKDALFLSEHIGEQQVITAGELVMPKTGAKIKIKDFYMDKYLVNNKQFADFLNHNLSRINIKNGVVKGDGANWLFLGEVYAGYEPIVFLKEGFFHVTKPDYLKKTVLRVTGYGASAFAKFFGRRLPKNVEILYVIQKNKLSNLYKSTPSGSENLNKNIGEWVTKHIGKDLKDSGKTSLYAVIGGVEGSSKDGKTLPEVVDRHPWEGFEEIGFRTVKTKSDSDSDPRQKEQSK